MIARAIGLVAATNHWQFAPAWCQPFPRHHLRAASHPTAMSSTHMPTPVRACHWHAPFCKCRTALLSGMPLTPPCGRWHKNRHQTVINRHQSLCGLYNNRHQTVITHHHCILVRKCAAVCSVHVGCLACWLTPPPLPVSHARHHPHHTDVAVTSLLDGHHAPLVGTRWGCLRLWLFIVGCVVVVWFTWFVSVWVVCTYGRLLWVMRLCVSRCLHLWWGARVRFVPVSAWCVPMVCCCGLNGCVFLAGYACGGGCLCGLHLRLGCLRL